MQSENNVQAQWRALFSSVNGQPNNETYNLANKLLDELPPTSPVRNRLASELDEIRKIHAA